MHRALPARKELLVFGRKLGARRLARHGNGAYGNNLGLGRNGTGVVAVRVALSHSVDPRRRTNQLVERLKAAKTCGRCSARRTAGNMLILVPT